MSGVDVVRPSTLQIRGVVLRRIDNAPSPTYIGSLGLRGVDAKYFVMRDDDFSDWIAWLDIDGKEHLLVRGATETAAAAALDQVLARGDDRLLEVVRRKGGRR